MVFHLLWRDLKTSASLSLLKGADDSLPLSKSEDLKLQERKSLYSGNIDAANQHKSEKESRRI